MGLFGIYGAPDASRIIYYGLHALQHRGQDTAGIVTFNSDGKAFNVSGRGRVNEVFTESNLSKMEGILGIGNVAYDGMLHPSVHCQPLFFRHMSGDYAIASDGCLVNASLIRDWLEDRGSLFQGESDAELLAHLIKKEKPGPRIFTIVDALNMMEGGYTFLILTKNRIYACRDKFGIKPLCLGRLGNAYVISSESCSFELIGAKFIRDIEPGELITIDHHGIRTRRYSQFQRHKLCAMEYIYYSRPDSDIDGCNVHSYRKESGRRLYQEAPADADIVIGVPDSSLSAAMGYAEASGIPYEMGLIKSKYVGRTFIEPSAAMRENGVKMKLSALPSIVRYKRVVLVDDSLVRGTTCTNIVKMLREAGASEVHVRIASPMTKFPCYYGVNNSTHSELLCNDKSLRQVCIALGADSVGFLSPESAIASCRGRKELCLGCFTGEYPTMIYKNEYEDID